MHTLTGNDDPTLILNVRQHTPRFSWRNSSCRNQARNELPQFTGGSRLSTPSPFYGGVARKEAGSTDESAGS
jgi:hypothetical protein